MQTKTDKLDDLFKRWKNSDVMFLNKFAYDGIINEKLYTYSRSKILYIEKDPNDPSQSEDWDFRELWQKEIYKGFSYRIAEWSFGILNRSQDNKFPEFDEIWEDKKRMQESIQSIAFMNVKKSGGASNSQYLEIKDHTTKFKDNILEEIEIIDPEFIILGLSWPDIRNNLFPLQWKKSGYGVEIAKYKNSKVIDFYHPSIRGSASAYYCLLQSVFQSHNFINL